MGSDPPIYSTLRNRPAFAALVRDFAAALPGLAADLAQALGAEDLGTTRTLAHRLKGSAAGYGFPEIARVASEIEASAAAGKHASAAYGVAALGALCERARAGAATPEEASA